ncbi:MAG: polyamine aminopropyltransferase [Alphaproteobacteria bacterium]|nr:polyamine aminopropyltransferase [Alphaproteobacteria bacterium]
MSDRWFSETLYPEFQQSFAIDEVLFEGRTAFQEAIIFQNDRFGRVLTLDGVIQTTERDEFCYHEMMVHVPMIAHGAAKNVLIIGGGDGGVLRETLKHPDARPTMIELDQKVVDICREHLPSLSDGVFDNDRADVRFMDGVKFVKESAEKFDVIIVDSTDPIGPGAVLFTDDFYSDCARCLTERGILVTQSGVTFMQGEEARATYQRMTRQFADPSFYITQVPTYAAGFMTFGWGCHSAEPRQTPLNEIERRLAPLNLHTKYYSAAMHVASFALPAYIEDLKR